MKILTCIIVPEQHGPVQRATQSLLTEPICSFSPVCLITPSSYRKLHTCTFQDKGTTKRHQDNTSQGVRRTRQDWSDGRAFKCRHKIPSVVLFYTCWRNVCAGMDSEGSEAKNGDLLFYIFSSTIWQEACGNTSPQKCKKCTVLSLVQRVLLRAAAIRSVVFLPTGWLHHNDHFCPLSWLVKK